MQFVYRTTLGKRGHLGLSRVLCAYLLRCKNFCVTIHTHLEREKKEEPHAAVNTAYPAGTTFSKPLEM